MDGKRSINSLVHNWMLFVRKIEQGYEEYIYKYENDRCIRDIADAAPGGTA